MPEYFSDLHCHPSGRPYNARTSSMWEAYRSNEFKLRKIIKKQKKGKRGGVYDQCANPKLSAGKTALVFASLYPLEKGFMTNRSNFLQWLEGLFDDLFGNRDGRTVRDMLLNCFLKYHRDAVMALKPQEYWQGLHEEYAFFLTDNGQPNEIGARSRQEIRRLINYLKDDRGVIIEDNLQDQHTYQILDGSSNARAVQALIDRNTPDAKPVEMPILHVLTLEGLNQLTQEIDRSRTTEEEIYLKLVSRDEMTRRIDHLKTTMPVFFITFCHHFDNGICGHATSIPRIAKRLAILNQDGRRNKPMTQLGMELLCRLLSINIEGGHIVDKQDDWGRRIYIDLKHTSLRGRLAVYQMVKNYNADKDDADKIPLIASHVGYANLTINQMLGTIDHETDDSQPARVKRPFADGEMRFNTWNINLAREEIAYIVDSNGLIGLSLEQNILGIEFQGGGKKGIDVQLVTDQLCAMAMAYGGPRFWNHIAIGSDFDGLINPVDPFTSVLFYKDLKGQVARHFKSLPPEARAAFFLPDDDGIDNLLADFCFNNAARLVRDYFDFDNMPTIPSSQPVHT